MSKHVAGPTKLRASFLAALTIIIYLSGIAVAGGILILIMAALRPNTAPALDNEIRQTLVFVSLVAVALTASVLVRTRMMISIKAVAAYLRDMKFQVLTKGKRLEAIRGPVQVSLFLESTWQSYEPIPRRTITIEGGRLHSVRRHGFDPSYMYYEGALTVLRNVSDVSSDQLRRDLECRVGETSANKVRQSALIIAKKPVGAWMGRHLLEEIRKAIRAAQG